VGRDEVRPDPGAEPRRGPESPHLAEVLAAARDDLARGHYALAAERTRDLQDEASACVLHVRALANLDDLAAAERACGRATGRHPLCGELHYLRAVLLVGLGRHQEAAVEARRVTCLDRSLAIAHFTLGSILRRLGDAAGAWRAFRNAHDLCAARPADEVVPLSDGECAGRLAEAARGQMEQLAGAAEGRR
jgi:chemotaxis protein methyltransferase CheR